MGKRFFFLELHNLANLYLFPSNAPEVTVPKGGSLTCNFDTEEEKCSWYNIPLTSNLNGFVRARYESVFDLDKFDCTSDRSFVFGKQTQRLPMLNLEEKSKNLNFRKNWKYTKLPKNLELGPASHYV